MSVCIGLFSDDKKKIICVSDERASFGDFSSETLAQKNIPFIGEWIVMFAGNDVEYVADILDAARAELTTAIKKKGHAALKGTKVAAALQKAYAKQMDALIEQKVLRRHKFTLETFLRDGRNKCTESVYNNLRNRIEQVRSLSLKLLACGFDDKEAPRVFVIDGLGPPADRSDIGMWAIGFGASSAMAALMFHADAHALTAWSELNTSLYCACEAKFMAESATDVGRKGTFVMVFDKDSRVQFISPPGIERIRKIWRSKGAPRIPKEALRDVPNLLYGFEKPSSPEEARKRIDAMVGKPGFMERAQKREERKREQAGNLTQSTSEKSEP